MGELARVAMQMGGDFDATVDVPAGRAYTAVDGEPIKNKPSTLINSNQIVQFKSNS